MNAALAAVVVHAGDRQRRGCDDHDAHPAISDAAGPADGTITLDVTPVNDAPAATNLTQTKTYTEGAASVALDDIVVSEVDTARRRASRRR